ncbi:glycosyl hydrolase family 3 C terminal domain-containing protein [Brochothrix thermosphacta DSM 20171 = FSL F6-1036]|nr:glycosyl hydrolase family 3 C terminal domain-containing protein [Brochothrix thermosphacta DSM 20171 = FSL F6-1036]
MIWSVVALAVVGVGIKVGPTAAHMYNVMTGKNITINTETPAGEKARAAGNEVARKIANEGIVLMKNEDRSLPLDDKPLMYLEQLHLISVTVEAVLVALIHQKPLIYLMV